MIVLYSKDDILGMEVYNGAEELRAAMKLLNKCPFWDADYIALRSGELFMDGIAGVPGLAKLLNKIEPERRQAGVEIYWEPVDTFIGKDKISAMIEEEYGLTGFENLQVLSNVIVDAFYGKLSEEELKAEITAAYAYTVNSLESDDEGDE